MFDPRRARRGRLLSISAIQMSKITRDAVLDLRHTALYLALRKVLVPGVDRLELGAVNGNAGVRQQTELTT